MTETDDVDADPRSMRERTLAGDLYRGADAELVAKMTRAAVFRIGCDLSASNIDTAEPAIPPPCRRQQRLAA